MRIRLLSCLLSLTAIWSGASAQLAPVQEASSDAPSVLGHGVGLFKVGKVLAKDEFKNLNNWVVQVQEKPGFAKGHVEVCENSLDCLLPGRGCTIWFKKKLPTRVTITYDVLCPTPKPPIKGVQPRDINNFWMAFDAEDPNQGLFDRARYNGAFGSYDKMHGYYASTGGGGAKAANLTTRMRRYPREVDGKPAEHIALNDKDGRAGYLITPDKEMSVQLVAFDDVIQYIVDGKLIYQIGHGDRIQVEGPDGKGEQVRQEARYKLDRFPVYKEGYFGFRMVGTHHIYSNFRVYALEPDDAAGARQRPTVRVSTLDALRAAVAKSNQQIILEPGDYKVSDDNGFRFSGSNNDIDLSAAYIEVPMEIASGNTLIRLTGDRITLRGGTFEDTYPDGMTEVTDFGGYNQGNKFGGMNEIAVSGDDNRIIGVKMTVRGSFPYGYGNMYGIGRGNALGRLRKHCGIQITGNRAVIDSCNIKMEAFGHVIYVQGGDQTTVRNTVIEGTLRPSNDCYDETDAGDLARRFNYQLQWPESVKGLPIPRNHMLNCTEDGIRAYKGAGEMIVENCVVKKCRGGIKLYMAKSARVSNCQVLDCVIQGYSLPSRGVISDSSGNAAYGPLLYVHFDSHSDQQIDLEVLPSPHGLGDHPLAAIKGRGHVIRFTQADSPASQNLRPIIVGYPMRFDFLCVDYPNVPVGYEDHFAKHSPKNYKASNMKIHNGTDHPIILGEMSRENSINSAGEIKDLGTNNSRGSTNGAVPGRAPDDLTTKTNS